MKYFLSLALFLLSFTSAATEDHDAVGSVLDALHEAASKAQSERYFSLFSDDAIFIGTAVTEVWDIPAFKAFAEPYFSQGKGWTYHPTKRNIYFSPDKNTAWFDEVLDSESYGVTRGTGVLLRVNNEWKIAQYHLTFPVPNEVADEVTQLIKSFRETSKAQPNQ